MSFEGNIMKENTIGERRADVSFSGLLDQKSSELWIDLSVLEVDLGDNKVLELLIVSLLVVFLQIAVFLH